MMEGGSESDPNEFSFLDDRPPDESTQQPQSESEQRRDSEDKNKSDDEDGFDFAFVGVRVHDDEPGPIRHDDEEIQENQNKSEDEEQDFSFLVEEEHETGCDQPFLLNRARPVETRGRPKGSLILRGAMGQVDMMELDPPPPQLTSLEKARQKRAENLAAQKRQGEVSVIAHASADPHSQVLFKIATSVEGIRDNASHVQRCIINASLFALSSQPSCSRDESVVMKLVSTPVVTSNRGLSALTDLHETRFAEESNQAACAVHECGSMLWGGLLHRIQSDIDGRKLEGLIILRRFRYDETPLRCRVKQFDRGSGTLIQDVADHAKLMQTEFLLQMLYRHVETGALFSIFGKLPTTLQAVERTTAKCTKACLVNILEKIPNLCTASSSFQSQIHLSCTDRYSANQLAEKSLGADDPRWKKGQFFCDSHRIAQVQGMNAKLVPQDTSGLLATSLAQRDLGVLSTLCGLLTEILLERLEICYDSPPKGRCADFRQQIFDRFLPLPTKLSRSRRDCKHLLRLKQRYVLGQLLNGDLESTRVVHFCTYGCCRSLEHTETKIRTWLVWSLLPHKAPKYIASRWTGQEASLSWSGLLCAHHNLFEDLFVRFAGIPPKGLQQPLFPLLHDEGDNDSFPDSLASGSLQPTSQRPQDFSLVIGVGAAGLAGVWLRNFRVEAVEYHKFILTLITFCK